MITMPISPTLARARRATWPVLRAEAAWADLAILFGAGALATLASVAIDGWGIPGSAVVQSVLPMAAGLALVPRSGAGLAMGSSSLATGLVIAGLHTGSITPSTLSRLFLLGLCLEVGPARRSSKGRVWIWFVLSGLVANLFGFGIKLLSASAGWEGLGGKGMFATLPAKFVSYAVCGAVAGLISAVIFFRRQDAGPRDR